MKRDQRNQAANKVSQNIRGSFFWDTLYCWMWLTDTLKDLNAPALSRLLEMCLLYFLADSCNSGDLLKPARIYTYEHERRDPGHPVFFPKNLN